MAETIKVDDFKHFEQEMTVDGHYLWESRSSSAKANTDEVSLTIKHIRMIDQDYVEEVTKLLDDEIVDRKVFTNLSGTSAMEQFESDWKRMWDPDRALEKLPPLGVRLSVENRHQVLDMMKKNENNENQQESDKEDKK